MRLLLKLNMILLGYTILSGCSPISERQPHDVQYDIDRIYENTDYGAKTMKICGDGTQIIHYYDKFFAEKVVSSGSKLVTVLEDNPNLDYVCQ